MDDFIVDLPSTDPNNDIGSIVRMKVYSDTGVYRPDNVEDAYERLIQVVGWESVPTNRRILQLRIRVGRFASTSRLWAELPVQGQPDWSYFTGINTENWWYKVPGFERAHTDRAYDATGRCLRQLAVKAHLTAGMMGI